MQSAAQPISPAPELRAPAAQPEALSGGPAGVRGPTPVVWAVGGGKGGVGKSIVTSSLAIALARRGQRCVLVDADFGGANLHTMLGIRHPRATLSHFLTGEVASLDELRCAGPVANLTLISGSQALLEMANLQHTRKEKLLRHLRQLDVEHVFLDLGAGSAYLVLDLFLAASRGILVVVPEPTSVENAYHFLKAAFFRALRSLLQDSGMRESVTRVLEERTQRRVTSPRQLTLALREVDPAAAQLLEEQAKSFRPMLIVNQARTREHRRIGHDIAIACRDHLGTELEYLGALERDECVRVAVGERHPVVERFPGSPFARDLGLVVERICRERPCEPAGRREDADCTLRPGRALRGEEPLAASGLFDEEKDLEPVQEEAACLRVAREIERAAPAAPELPVREAASAPLPELDPEAAGAWLRRCRELLGLELATLAQRTRILCLEAIEQERFEAVPPEPFIRGLVENYARALGVKQPQAAAAAFVARMRIAAQRQRDAAATLAGCRSPGASRPASRSLPSRSRSPGSRSTPGRRPTSS
jgi:flagellar biosynthesis protein FlhG